MLLLMLNRNDVSDDSDRALPVHHRQLQFWLHTVFIVDQVFEVLTDSDFGAINSEVVPEIAFDFEEVMIGLPSMQTLQGHGKGRKLTKVVSKCDSISSSLASSLNETPPEIL